MAIEQGLFQYIQSSSQLAALADTTNGKGVYWVLMPKGKGASVPCVVLSRTATTDTYAMQGSLKYRGALFQADCYGASYYSSRALADAVRGILNSLINSTLPDGTVTSGAQITKDWDMPYEEGGLGFVYRALLEFRVWYRES